MSSAVISHHVIKPLVVEKDSTLCSLLKFRKEKQAGNVSASPQDKTCSSESHTIHQEFLSQDRMRRNCVSSQGTEHPLGCNLDVLSAQICYHACHISDSILLLYWPWGGNRKMGYILACKKKSSKLKASLFFRLYLFTSGENIYTSIWRQSAWTMLLLGKQ